MLGRRPRPAPEPDLRVAHPAAGTDAQWLAGHHPVDERLTAGAGARVVLIGKPGCHLCDVARDVVARVCADRGEPFVERSTLDDVEHEMAYWQDIPVLLVDGRRVARWRIEHAALHAALDR